LSRKSDFSRRALHSSRAPGSGERRRQFDREHPGKRHRSQNAAWLRACDPAV